MEIHRKKKEMTGVVLNNEVDKTVKVLVERLDWPSIGNIKSTLGTGKNIWYTMPIIDVR
jgi:hypothetical protein